MATLHPWTSILSLDSARWLMVGCRIQTRGRGLGRRNSPSRFWLSLGLLMMGSGSPLFSQPDLLTHFIHSRLAQPPPPPDEKTLTYPTTPKGYFSVRRFDKQGCLVRSDSYERLPEQAADGWPLDSLSRIIRQGPAQIYYSTGRTYLRCYYKNNQLDGPFRVYYPDGQLKREEYYRRGHRRKSHCYSLSGEPQRWQPLYQVAQFGGDQKQLEAYFAQQFAVVLAGNSIHSISLTLVIDEAGEISQTKVELKGSTWINAQVGDVAIYAQRIVERLPRWWADVANFKPALNDGMPIVSTCVVSLSGQTWRWLGHRGLAKCAIKYELLP